MIHITGVFESHNWIEEMRSRTPTEWDLRNIREMRSTGWTSTAIATGLELSVQTVRKALKNTPKPIKETAEQRTDREMLGRVR
jgi:DNA invertase Pin-like site-specific DNA recombinase